MKDLETEVKEIAEHLGCNEGELWSEMEKLFEKKIREARLERGIYELERLHHIPQMFGDWEKVVDERIALLESEQLKDSKASKQ